MKKQEGACLQTFTGIQFWPLDPNPEDIDIRDIAHSLSLQCRFAGHTRCFYSVAEHSLRVSDLCSSKNKLWGLLHDASEAYLVDLPRPIKNASVIGFEYQKIEIGLNIRIAQKYNLPMTKAGKTEITHFDDVLLATEARDLMGAHPASRCPLPEPLREIINPLTAAKAEYDFLTRFNILNA